MHLFDTIRKTFVPIHPAGYPFIAGFFVASLVLGLLWEPLFWMGLILTAWSAYFFRDPERMTPLDSDAVFSPADGIVSAVGPARPPAELDLGDQDVLRISVFMNVFSCHVNRTPVDGPIRRIAYRKGAFLNADLDKASSENERNGLVIETDHGNVGVVQVAGLVARRILCFVEEGQTVAAGERIGLIRFGSRLDVYLPSAYQPAVALGQTAIAGETRIAFVGPGGTMPPMVRRD